MQARMYVWIGNDKRLHPPPSISLKHINLFVYLWTTPTYCLLQSLMSNIASCTSVSVCYTNYQWHMTLLRKKSWLSEPTNLWSSRTYQCINLSTQYNLLACSSGSIPRLSLVWHSLQLSTTIFAGFYTSGHRPEQRRGSLLVFNILVLNISVWRESQPLQHRGCADQAIDSLGILPPPKKKARKHKYSQCT